MSIRHKVLWVGVVIAAAALAFAFKNQKAPKTAVSSAAAAAQPAPALAPATKPLPRLIDLGADKCIPCKMMAPILEELKTEFAGRLEVEFIDVWKNPNAGRQYGIEVIPTQIFYNAQGKELARHVGFISKEDLLKKWKELGVDLTQPAPARP